MNNMTRKLKHRICLAVSAVVAMIFMIITIYLPQKDVHVSVPYNAHTFRLLASNNTFLPYDIESFGSRVRFISLFHLMHLMK